MDYEKKIKEQIRQYENNALRFFPPPVHKFWMHNYIWPKVRDVFEDNNLANFYANPILDSKGPLKILSVGSGDGQLEISIARKLMSAGREDFRIHVTELSPIRQKRTIERVKSEALEDHFKFHIVDFNSDFVTGRFDLIFAHHVLHHIVELEFLFDNIKKALKPTGTFATVDMIGRNGHMRWPEALEYTEMAWAFLPDHWKHNFQMNAFHKDYVNFDCSKSGFEGIRAQDILPLLVERFDFDRFVAGGGFTDIIFERGYGQSIDMDNPREKALVRFLSEMNEMLLETGRIKPTMVFAHMHVPSRRRKTKTLVHGNMTPDFAIRPIDTDSADD